jgi:Distinct helicase family with a unique C-terminal domain including a metal-binding cysteine cluster
MLQATSTLELGIDIPDVSVVIQYKLPMKSEVFIQRLGRAGRNPESYRVVVGVIILSQSPHSAAYMYDSELQEKLLDVKKLPKSPVNITNRNLQLKYQFYKLLIDYKRNGGDTHYPIW